MEPARRAQRRIICCDLRRMADQNGSASAGALVAVGEARSALFSGGPGEGLDTHTRAIGVIAPPPDIRAIADKTAQFVARNGAFQSALGLGFMFAKHRISSRLPPPRVFSCSHPN